ncbi:MAG: imidazolonepropionase [Bacteroidales bacterium]|nr:imidazolonepropionase [Bacteroidales bacterium]MBR1799847.1 imidazolonepropionase [Bacteroidales bacterium]
MRTLVKNIKLLINTELVARTRVQGSEMSHLDNIANAFLIIADDTIEAFGSMSDPRLNVEHFDREIDASGRMVMPSFCDSHTHLVYAGSREIEYVDKIRGLSYEEIAQRGGGILNSALRVQQASEQELYDDAMLRIAQMTKLGTGAVEIKSGYGMTVEAEMKMLRVVRHIKETAPLVVRATLLGAHGIPLEYRGRQEAFVDLVVDRMIPQAADEGLADFIDVFCDRGFFTVAETERMLEAGAKHGMRAKIHANELACSGGIQCAVKWNALSCDHLEYTGADEIAALQGSATMPTILPGAAFFLNMPFAPARTMIDAGLGVAMASDCNPGSSPSVNMQLILSMACINYRLLPEEAINATTLNTAYAMGVSHMAGSIAVGKKANFFITKPVPTLEYLPYSYGENKVERAFLNGKEQ